MDISKVVDRAFDVGNQKLELIHNNMTPEAMGSPAHMAEISMKISEVGMSWTFSSSMVKDLTEAMKSIVNR